MRTFLITAITLSATFGPICPLQLVFAAPIPEEEVLMSVAGAEDLQTCIPQDGSSIGRRPTSRGCPTDRCFASFDEEQPDRGLALAPPLTVKDATPSARFTVDAEQGSRFQVPGSKRLLAFNDTNLSVVKRE